MDSLHRRKVPLERVCANDVPKTSWVYWQNINVKETEKKNSTVDLTRQIQQELIFLF